jgi:hypothetical protein
MKFGKFKDLTVETMLGMRKVQELVSAYYKLSTINYTEDILIELGIVGEWVIKKPSKDKDKYYDFLEHINYQYKSKFKGADHMKSKTRSYTRGQLQGFNHGR